MYVEILTEPKITLADAVVVQLEGVDLIKDYYAWCLAPEQRDMWTFRCGSSGLGRLFDVYPAEFKDRLQGFFDNWSPQ